jgi:imidazolonepropionase-like amidohydrolase
MRSIVDAPPSVGIPADVRERLGRALSSLGPTLRSAVEAGVRILAGTDAALPHGMVRDEVSALVETGLPAERAVAGASWEGREYLGLPGLEEGAPADLVAFARDPREDLEELGRPSLIMLEGRVIPPGSA